MTSGGASHEDGEGQDAGGRDAASQGAFSGMPQPLYAASPTRLLTYVDCPRRYRLTYLDRPRPQPAPQRAHTSLGIAVHNALRDWWEVPPPARTPDRARAMVREAWVATGFRDEAMSRRWLTRTQEDVVRYLGGIAPGNEPRAVERTVSVPTATLRLTGRVDRVDERPGPGGGTRLVVVDYKTSRRPSTTDELRTSLPMAVYALAVARTFRRECVDVELHHVPTGRVVGHRHTPQSLARKVEEAESIGADLRRADADFARRGEASEHFPARPSGLCGWCDVRQWCEPGRAHAPEKAPWAALEPDA